MQYSFHCLSIGYRIKNRKQAETARTRRADSLAANYLKQNKEISVVFLISARNTRNKRASIIYCRW